VRILDAGDVDATLRALAADSRVNVLSTPRILSVNNNEARILVGSEVPFVQFQRSTIAESVDRVVQFRNVGLELTVTPRINPDRYVTLDLLQQVSSLSPDVLFDAPIITTREAETSLVVGDRQTVVLGGLIEDRKEKRKSGVPILKDIPILGWLFGSTETRTVKTELVITLTPYIVGSDEELQAVRGEIEAGTEFYRDELQERIDEGRPVPGQLGPQRAPGEPAPQPVAPSPVLTPPAELPGGVPPAGVPPDTIQGRLEFDSAPAGEPFDEPRTVIGDTLPSWEP
jgi:type II secretory pathway component GspD/PulD (secretin)